VADPGESYRVYKVHSISGVKGNAQLLLRRLANRRELNREDIRDALEHRGGQPIPTGLRSRRTPARQTVEARDKLARPELRRATVGGRSASYLLW